jgi:hypothetical protein
MPLNFYEQLQIPFIIKWGPQKLCGEIIFLGLAGLRW